MVTTQEWTAPIFPPTPAVLQLDEHGAPVLVNGTPVVLHEAIPGNTKAEIVLFDHPVRHTKAGQPDAHARRIVEAANGRRLEEVYLNRSYAVSQVRGTYSGTAGQVRMLDSKGKVLHELALHHPGPFTLWGDALELKTGFSVTLEHLGGDWAEGAVSVAFRQEETEVSRA